MEKTKNEKIFIISVLVTLLFISLCIGEAFAAKTTKKDFIDHWGPFDPSAKNPFVMITDDKNNLVNIIMQWDQGLASHSGSRIEFLCEYDGKNSLDCKGKQYEYYPIRNGKRISSEDMTDEELSDENFPIGECLIDNHVYVKYKLKKYKFILQRNHFTGKLEIKFNHKILDVVDASERDELWGSLVH